MRTSLITIALLAGGLLMSGGASAGHDDHRYRSAPFSGGYSSAYRYRDHDYRHGHRHDRHCRHGNRRGHHGNRYGHGYRQNYGYRQDYGYRNGSHYGQRHHHRYGVVVRIGRGYDARRYHWCDSHGGYFLRGDFHY